MKTGNVGVDIQAIFSLSFTSFDENKDDENNCKEEEDKMKKEKKREHKCEPCGFIAEAIVSIVIPILLSSSKLSLSLLQHNIALP